MHHRFMPWWAIVWMPMLVTMSTMAFSPSSFHYMILYVMYENAMSILKLGASLEGLLGLKGSMTWTVTQKLGTAQAFDLQKSASPPLTIWVAMSATCHPGSMPILFVGERVPCNSMATHRPSTRARGGVHAVLKNVEIFFRELAVAGFLMGSAIYGHYVGASWVFTVYFFTQGLIFLIFSLSLVEAFNLQPPSEAKLLGLEVVREGEVTQEMQPVPPAGATPSGKASGRKPRQKRSKSGPGYQSVAGGDDDDDDDDEEENEEVEGLVSSGGGKHAAPPQPPSLMRVLYANAVIFLYTLPINAFSILLLYGVTTMALSEMINTQWDDVVALTLVLVVIPCHMFWCLGNPSENWRHRKLARQRRLPLSVRLKHFLQLQLLYFYLFLVFLISMYSASATLQVRAHALGTALSEAAATLLPDGHHDTLA